MIRLTTYERNGGPLDNGPVDQNWLDIEEAINNITAGLEVESSEMDSNGALIIRFTNGTTIGPWAAPAPRFKHEGEWASGTAYDVNDIVTHEGSSYIVTELHQAGVFAVDLADGKLGLLASAGASGGGTGGIEEAPIDGRRYSRMDGEWAREDDKAIWDWMPPTKSVNGAVVGLFRPRKAVRYSYTQPFNGVGDKTYSDVDYDLGLYLFSPRTLVTRFKKVNGTFVEDGIPSDIEIPATGILTLETENAAVAPGVEFLLQTALAIQFDPAA